MKKRVCLLIGALALAASTAFAAKLATVDIPVNAQMYAATPTPLQPSQCAQCHTGQFGALKENGGKHRFDCQQCHKVIHAYNPNKANYAEIMPKCSNCHTEIHGPANKDCSSCHTNPHTPRKVAMTDRLMNTCQTCHPGPKADLVQFPSKHSLLGCQRCHTSHGFKPSCEKCHKTHFAGQSYDTCTKCHSVHKPKQVTYGSDADTKNCGACHKVETEKIAKTPSRHHNVSCAQCHHNKHGYIPQCTECHKQPHPASILQRFPKCLGCHLDVHNLPSMK
ncbi:MAG TPA: cytochrome C [Geomonas sp.]|nr:cytochrome C [Geomonas sp.]